MIDLDTLEQVAARMADPTGPRYYPPPMQMGGYLLALIAELRASRGVVEAARRAISQIMAQPGEFTTDEVGLDDLLSALAELETTISK